MALGSDGVLLLLIKLSTVTLATGLCSFINDKK